jgi:hypothetical protein
MRPTAVALAAVASAVASTVALAALVPSCSNAPPVAPLSSPDAGPCGEGYLAAVNGACPKGTCLESEASAACCGSQCATCEDEGLVALDDAGACGPGLCLSTDVTVALTCCDVCLPGEEAGVDDAASD